MVPSNFKSEEVTFPSAAFHLERISKKRKDTWGDVKKTIENAKRASAV